MYDVNYVVDFASDSITIKDKLIHLRNYNVVTVNHTLGTFFICTKLEYFVDKATIAMSYIVFNSEGEELNQDTVHNKEGKELVEYIVAAVIERTS